MPVNFISILRLLAVLLVINSHCGVFYPSSLSVLGTGGALANAIFFFCSGFTLHLSNKNIGFVRWMTKRIIRIYPSVWIFLLFCNLFIGEKYSIDDFIITPFWFVNAIFIFYILFYFISKYIPQRLTLIIGLLCIPYLLTFFFLNDYSVFLIDWVNNGTYLHWYYYFGLMLLGAYCSNHCNTVHNSGLKLFITLFLYFTLKFIVKHNESLYLYQVLIPLGLFPICWYIFRFAKKMEPLLHEGTFLYNMIKRISRLSLDTYITQFSIIAFYQTLNMPFRLILVFISVILAAEILYRASDFCRKWIIKILPI